MKKKILTLALAFACAVGSSFNTYIANPVEVQAATLKYLDDLDVVEFATKTDLYLWSANHFDDKGTIVGPLKSNNRFYVSTGKTSFNVRFLPTNEEGIYQIQLPGNYFYVDDSVSYSDSVTSKYYPGYSFYKPVQKYYLLGQRPKYSNTRASWKIEGSILDSGKYVYTIQNVATGRYFYTTDVDPGTSGSDLKLVLYTSPTNIWFTKK